MLHQSSIEQINLSYKSSYKSQLCIYDMYDRLSLLPVSFLVHVNRAVSCRIVFYWNSWNATDNRTDQRFSVVKSLDPLHSRHAVDTSDNQRQFDSKVWQLLADECIQWWPIDWRFDDGLSFMTTNRQTQTITDQWSRRTSRLHKRHRFWRHLSLMRMKKLSSLSSPFICMS